MFDFSPVQIIIVLVIALVVFGPKRLPEMGRSIGRGLREFKGSISGDTPAQTTPADPTRGELPKLDELVDARQETPAVTPEVAEAGGVAHDTLGDAHQDIPAPTPEVAEAEALDEAAEPAGAHRT